MALVNEATAAVAAKEAYWLSQVRVVNLYSNSVRTEHQSMLTLVPEPASMAVWGLLATALGGGLYLRRRRAQ